MSLSQLFFLIQIAVLLPAMPNGTEVRLVSMDLLTVYASARVEAGSLVFSDFPPAGTEVRVLIFPPDAVPAERAAAASGARALTGRISSDGRDVMLEDPELDAPMSLRDVLLRERGVSLELSSGQEE